MIQYPIHFSTEASAVCGISASWIARSVGLEITVAIPTEFEGPGGAISPEDLYAQALTNCFLATYKVLAEKSRVTFERITVEGRLMVDRNELKQPTMQTIHFVIKLTAPSDEAKARRLVEKALHSGFILNSVKTELSHELVILGDRENVLLTGKYNKGVQSEEENCR